MSKKILLLFSIIFVFSNINAQENVWVKGIVTDAKHQPVYGASVYIKGTLFGIKTNIRGEYELPIPRYYLPAVIVFRASGFEQQEINVDGTMSSVDANVQFASNNIVIQEVVVTASKRVEKIVDAPASISILTEEKIKKNPFISPAEQLKKLPGVDNIQVNLVVNSLSIRGFNNLFSQSALAIIDNRLVSLPSLRFNAYQLIPNNISDFKKIELVRGPASALYGPNASYGVINIITKSPLDQKNLIEASVSMLTGFRSIASDAEKIYGYAIASGLSDRMLYQPEGRISIKFNESVGMKISGTYLKAYDYEHYDPLEPRVGKDTVIYGVYQQGQAFQEARREVFKKDFSIDKASVDLRFDFKLAKDLFWIINGGYTSASNIGLSPLGTNQSEHFKYIYGQTRLNYKSFFFQTYLNYNDAGNSSIIPRDRTLKSQLLFDQSKQFVVQAQNSNKFGKCFTVYGVDFSYTKPQTFGTVFGRNEDSAQILQIGAYNQFEYKPIDKLTLLAALRVDYQNIPKEIMLSPRGAIVFKPNKNHALRLTYNRAFNSPSTLNLFGDIFERSLGNGINVRAIGNSKGFQYNRNSDNVLQFGRPGEQLFDVQQKADNSVHLQYLNNLILNELSAENSDPNQLLPQYLNKLTEGIEGGTINNVEQKTIDYVVYNNQKVKDQKAAEVDLANINDLKSLKNTVTQTIEFGYKFLQSNTFSLGIDLYYSIRDNFLSTSTNASYSVVFDEIQLRSAMETKLRENVNKLYNDPVTKDKLLTIFDQSAKYGGNGNGDAYDEILNLYLTKNNRQTLGTIAPNKGNYNLVGDDIVLTNINVGKADIFGSDVYTSWYPTKSWEIAGNFSFINKDKILFSQASAGYVALNAPKYKSQLSMEYSFYDRTDVPIGLSLKATWRWQDAFPAFSSIWKGNVVAANFVDVNATYTPRFAKSFTINISVNNLLDNLFQGFPGTAYIGRMALLKLQYNLSVKNKAKD